MRKIYLICVTLVVVALAILALVYAVYWANPVFAERYCVNDADCACGVHVRTGACFYGNKNYVNTEEQCPDFCTGIAANFEIVCSNMQCVQVQK